MKKIKPIKAWAIMETDKRIMKSVSEFEQFEIYKTRSAAGKIINRTEMKIEIISVLITPINKKR